ncbi:MAG: methyl-accepting chemotaxis protein, partial [Paenibacillaceae bacterium]|nr:methyl-accepting chemotaxis protein [Paenibacillaceae bacterium]
LKAELGDDVVFAAIAEPDGKLLYASDDKAAALDPALQGTLKQSYDTKQTTMRTSAYDGKKVDYYVSVLSDNRAFVVALSTEVLTNIRNTIVIATAILVLLAGTVLFYIVHRQIRRLRLLQSAMVEIGEGDGDLTRRLPQTARDEIGVLSAAANRFIDKIHSIVADVKSAAETSKADSDDMKQVSLQTMELAKEINVTIHQVATATNEQAEQVEQGLVAVQELAAYVDQSKRKTEELSAAKRSIEDRQARGLDAVAALTRLMSRNVEVSQDAQRQLEQLKADIDAIAQMTDVIAGISRQTGLLALNASIEAARAGEHGKGFSVVATEVRKLSDQANAATEQIRATVDNVLASATNTAQSMDAVAGIVREQENSVRSTSSAFTDIREVLLEMNERIAQIASAMDVLDGKKETIVAFVESASAVSEQTAASAEEIVATVESQMTGFENVGRLALQLNRTMGRLQQAVDRFRI